MQIRRVLMTLCIMMMIGLSSGVVYANDTKEGYNIETATITKDDDSIEILQSQDGGYLKITQIGQNSEKVQIITSTFDQNILLCGRAPEGTELTIDIYQDDTCFNSYSTIIGVTEIFSENIDLEEGENEVRIVYCNSRDNVEDYVAILIRRESAEDIEKLTAWLDVPSLE